MRNLTGLIPSIYAALSVVSRETVGFIGAVHKDMGLERAAVNQDIVVPVVPALTAQDVDPSMNLPDDDGVDVGNIKLKITKSRSVKIPFTGEEVKGLESAGTYDNVMQQKFAQAMRTLTNELEADTYKAAVRKSFAGAVKAKGESPLVEAVKDTAFSLKLMQDAGAPTTDLQFITDTLGGAYIRSNTNLSRASEAGTDKTLRDGALLRLNGFSLGESGQITSGNTITGTAAGYTTAASAIEEGSTSITFSAGTGTILEGDLITIAGDDQVYTVTKGVTTNAGTLEINPPLQKATPAAATAVTVSKASRSVFFPRSAMALVTRAPAMPKGGDARTDATLVTDPISGLTFEISEYKGYKKVFYEVALAWGVDAVNPEHIGVLI